MRPRTTLVLGAGASCPYGFPTASELRDVLVHKNQQRVRDVFSRLRARTLLWDDVATLLAKRFGPELLGRFQNEFFWSQTGSIDEFVQERAELFGELAKTALAALFLNCEQSSYLDGNWYRVFRRWLLAKGPDHMPLDRVQVVTFNYDRSLEYYLWRAIQYTYGIAEGTAFSLASKLPVYHVYGSLGNLRVGSATTNPVPWGSTDELAIQEAANSLHLVQPRSRGLPNKVAQLITQSEFICFLGFGFWAENFELVEKQVGPAAQVFASDKGLAKLQKDVVTARFPKITWGDGWTAEDCMQGWNLFP